MKHRWYILNGKIPEQVDDIFLWTKWRESHDVTIKKTQVGDAEVSTVFLGMDHNWNGKHPILFETMIFGGEFDGYQTRYRTYAGAERGHEKTVKMVTDTVNKKE